MNVHRLPVWAALAVGLVPAGAQAGLSQANVAHMAKLGVQDAVILTAVRASGLDFPLNAAAIVALHKKGVPTHLLDALLDTTRGPGAACAGGGSTATAAEATPEPERATPRPATDAWRK